MNINHLALSWSTSRGAETYGYNICRLDDRATDKRYKCLGGGYDMVGTVFGDWLQDQYQARLLTIGARAHSVWKRTGLSAERGGEPPADSLYGMAAEFKANDPPDQLNKVSLDGACGIGSMIRIAEAIGLEVQREGDRKGRTIGFYIQDTQA